LPGPLPGTFDPDAKRLGQLNQVCLALVGLSLALVSDPLALVGDLVPLVSRTVPLVSRAVPFVGQQLALVNLCLAHRGLPLTLGHDRLYLVAVVAWARPAGVHAFRMLFHSNAVDQLGMVDLRGFETSDPLLNRLAKVYVSPDAGGERRIGGSNRRT
jgi:hypothetical protein